MNKFVLIILIFFPFSITTATLCGEPPEAHTLFELTSSNILSGIQGKQYGTVVQHEGVLRCELPEPVNNPWDFGLRYIVDASVQKGEVLVLKFKAKTLHAQTETGLGAIRPFFERSSQPFSKSLYSFVEIGLTEREYTFPFSCGEPLSPGQSAFGLFLGDFKQALEIRDLQLLSYGTDYQVATLPDSSVYYEGQDLDAPWRHAAIERINRIRKGDLTIQVLDKTGNALPNATLKIHETNPLFRWGTAVVANRILDPSEDGCKYRDFIEKHFNVVVFENDLKWYGWLNPDTRASVFKALDWFDERGIAVRGHNFVWPSWRNSNRRWRELETRPDELRKVVKDHILSESRTLAGRCFEWDVVNEPYDNRELWELLGKGELVEWFKTARLGDPTARLFINDYGILTGEGLDRKKQDFYYETIQDLLEAGAPLGGIGFQGHFGERATPPSRIVEVIERFSQFGLPIAITEHDVDTQNSQYQAMFTRDFLTAVFSCESVEEILVWGFWSKSHWRPNAAYVAADWTLTPAGKVWLDLTEREWRTNATLVADTSGFVHERVFLGEYEITVEDGATRKSFSISVPKEGATVTIQLER